MKLVRLIAIKINVIKIIFRRVLNYNKLKSTDIILLSNVRCRFTPKKILIGKRFTVLQNSILEFNNTANIKIGDYCQLSYGVVMAIKGDFSMGDFVMVGEYTSIRDFSHTYTDLETPMALSNDQVKNITIGNNVWIGRGCIIMPGTTIEDGVVIGANSFVKGYFKANGIYAGNPAKFIKNRIS